MKKREFLATLAVMATLGVSACGAKELELTTNQVEVELGSELDTAVATYVADADVAAEATVDFSAVDMTKTGTYSATVTYKDQTTGFDVIVVDTTAPEVTVADQIVAAAGEPLYAKDVITGITELGGEVEVTFSEPETVDGAETAEGTEFLENTEIVEESTEEAGDTEAEEGTESAVDSAEPTETAEPEAEFVIGDVICSNAYVIYPETGEYDNTLTVTDASGNSTEVTVHIVVGDAPEINGVEDITVTVGTDADEIDYLDGVTATDSNGNDITANVACNSAAVDLTAAGEYEITYMVTDENGFTATKTATVTVEEKSGKKSDSKKSNSGKTDAKTDASRKGNSSSSGNGNAASAGTSGNSNASDTSSSGNNDNSGNSNSGNSSNSNQASSGDNTSGDTGNTSTPSADNSSNTSTPSTDNSGSAAAPSTPAPAPETPSTPSTDAGSSSGGEMAVPDGVVIEPYDPSANAPRDDELGGSGAYWE